MFRRNITGGYTLGGVSAMMLSYLLYGNFWWALVSGLFSWLYIAFKSAQYLGVGIDLTYK